MPYISNTIGTSPFLTTFHYYHIMNQSNYLLTSPQNGSYLATSSGETNRSIEQQKLLNPLNTYSGNPFSTHKMYSPFSRGQIYYGKKNPLEPSSSHLPNQALISQIDSKYYALKKENPFYKKYLLEEKNKKIFSYAYSSNDNLCDLIQFKNRENNQQKNQKYFDTFSQSQQNFGKQEISPKAIKQTLSQFNCDEKLKYETQNQNQNQNFYYPSNLEDRDLKQKFFASRNYEKQAIIESEDQKKSFGTFGQPMQQLNLDIENQNEQDKNGQLKLKLKQNGSVSSMIDSLTKIINDDNQNKKKQRKGKKEPVLIDSEANDPNNGQFNIRSEIIEEINYPSNLIQKNKENLFEVFHQKDKNIDKKKQSKQAILTINHPPRKITLRGKVYEKIIF